MKKVILLIFALFVTTSAFSQGVLNLLGRSQDFFKLLEDQKYTEAYGYLDSTFKAKVPEEDLKKLWTQVSEKLGKIETLDVVSSKTQGEFFVVTLEGKFTNEDQNFLLAFNKAEKIVGFFLQPKSTAPSYTLPAYADTTLYKETEINIKTPGHSLVGILTAPKNLTSYPVVVLVHGSGPADMDGTVGPNKPLKDIAVGLASKGVGSIRYVKRTMIYAAEFRKTFTVKEELMDDALAALALARTLPQVNKKQIYLLGHDLGGMLAPRMATLAPDLNGIIMLAAPARKFTELLIEQNKYMFSLSKDTSEALKKSLDTVIKELAETGKLLKVHGGAASKSFVSPFNAQNEVYALNEKKKIAEKTLKLIKNEMVILTEGGTTILELAKMIPENLRVTFFTISPQVAITLSDHSNLEVITIGGKLNKNANLHVGASVINQLVDIKVDLCLLGANAFSSEEGLTDMDWDIVQVKKAIIRSSKKIAVLSISEKLNSAQRIRICDPNQINYLITELPPESPFLINYRNDNLILL